MLNNFKAFEFQNKKIRTFIGVDNNPLFVAKDIALALEYVNTVKAISTHCRSQKSVKEYTEYKESESHPFNENKDLALALETLHPQTVLIDKRDVFTLIMRSNQPNAIEFQNWVFEVIDSITNTHNHSVNELVVTVNTLTKTIDNLNKNVNEIKQSIPVIKFKDHDPIVPFPGYDVATLIKIVNQNSNVKAKIKDGYDYLINLNLVDSNNRYMPTAYGLETNAVNVIASAFTYSDRSVGLTKKIVVHRQYTKNFIDGIVKYLNKKNKTHSPTTKLIK